MGGFSWEKSFDVTLEVIGDAMGDSVSSHWYSVLLSAITISVVFPAWLWYIIPMKMEHGYRYGFVPRRVSDLARRAFKEAGTHTYGARRCSDKCWYKLLWFLPDSWEQHLRERWKQDESAAGEWRNDKERAKEYVNMVTVLASALPNKLYRLLIRKLLDNMDSKHRIKFLKKELEKDILETVKDTV